MVGWLLRKQHFENCQLKLMAKDSILCWMENGSPKITGNIHTQTTDTQTIDMVFCSCTNVPTRSLIAFLNHKKNII